MRWMMYRWWCEGGGDRAWWVIESAFLRVLLCNLMLKLRGISRSSAILGSNSPQSNNRKDHSLWVTLFTPRERPNVKHAIAGYLRLPWPTSAPALMQVLHWLRCWAEEPGYATGNPPEDYSQIRGSCSCLWMIAVDQCFRIMPYTAFNRRNTSLMRVWLVIVVNYCFTSFFGTDGHLSDIVIR